ncbi:helix-turn-helix domain-containing protein [Oligosphaera ethanolica]|uniref:Transcriptional regulator with XRE-family HTH domain n=1 Tax=Oligosphaera ethanolica TaxID=760260 RepID=A0AAE3VGZ5_9BACT|nr:helix-turn-helix transcriptional regulator [Oligosphaera ethanolica]MDQ0290205.1 transcriptional regulator with XRE-family HTH domain [Oligosphaera ethanolica]
MATPQNGFSGLFDWAEQQDDYWLEGVKIEFAEQILAQMDARGMSRKELARRLGTSPAYVTKILRGTTNFTLESMVSIARALDCELRAYLHKEGTRSIGSECQCAACHEEAMDYTPTAKQPPAARAKDTAAGVKNTEAARGIGRKERNAEPRMDTSRHE